MSQFLGGKCLLCPMPKPTYGNMAVENIMHQYPQKSCREKVCRIDVFQANLGKISFNILITPKRLPVPAPTPIKYWKGLLI